MRWTKIINAVWTMSQVAKMTTLFFMWLASCHYLLQVGREAATVCFYMGAIFLILAAGSCPRLQSYIKRKEGRL